MEINRAVEKDIEDMKSHKSIELYSIDQAIRASQTFIKTRHKNECSFWKGRYFELFRAKFKYEVNFSK